MKRIKNETILLVGKVFGKKARLLVLGVTIALFVLAAGAPNATIGIGR